MYVAAIAAHHDAVDGKSVGKHDLGHQVPQRGEKVKSSAPSSGTLLGSPLGPDGLEGGAL